MLLQCDTPPLVVAGTLLLEWPQWLSGMQRSPACSRGYRKELVPALVHGTAVRLTRLCLQWCTMPLLTLQDRC